MRKEDPDLFLHSSLYQRGDPLPTTHWMENLVKGLSRDVGLLFKSQTVLTKP